MGNTESRNDPEPASTNSTKPATEGARRSDKHRHQPSSHSHSLSHGSHGARKVPSTPTPPTHLVTPGSTSTSTSTALAHGATVSSSPKRVHTRTRSTTIGTPKLEDLSLSHKSDSASMGSAESKQQQIRPPSRSNTLPTHAKATRPATPSSTTVAEQEKSPPSLVSRAVDVPPHPSSVYDGAVETDQDDYIPAGYSQSPYGLPPANYSRPPRLPLPIEEEVHTPGSPILSPSDITSPLDSNEIEAGAIPRKTSVLSSTTIDEDEAAGEYDAFAEDPYQTKVPTKLEWKGEGDSVFVTGTFCNWEKKYKMAKNKDGTPGFSLMVPLTPGTHHLKYLVGSEMLTTPDLPTTVDWANILVNYIEVLAPLPSPTDDEKQAPTPAEPMPIPGAAVTAGQATAMDLPAATSVSTRPPPETAAEPPSTLRKAVDGKDETAPTAAIPIQVTPTPRQQSELPKPESKPKPAAPKAKLPRPKYTNQIPEFLIDLDNYNNPEDERFQRAQKLAATLPQPPSLPMFLSKSILNGATPHKDDASVLIMPNHTVLNHLATSSIKSGVLATSGTTRYKRKFLTTIMYKPTSDDG